MNVRITRVFFDGRCRGNVVRNRFSRSIIYERKQTSYQVEKKSQLYLYYRPTDARSVEIISYTNRVLTKHSIMKLKTSHWRLPNEGQYIKFPGSQQTHLLPNISVELFYPAVHPTFESLLCSHRFELPMGNCWEIIVRVFFFFPFTFITFDRRIIIRFIIGRREKLRTDIPLFRKRNETTYI